MLTNDIDENDEEMTIKVGNFKKFIHEKEQLQNMYEETNKRLNEALKIKK